MAAAEKKRTTFTFSAVGADARKILPAVGHGRALDATLTTDAVSGTTPTSDVTLEGSWDGGTTWVVLATWTQVTETDTVEAEVVTTRYPSMLSLNIDVGGTSPVYNYTLDLWEHDN